MKTPTVCAVQRAAVLHVLGTATRYRVGAEVPTDQLRQGALSLLARANRRMVDIHLRGFTTFVAEVQDSIDQSVLDDVMLNLACEGATNMASHMMGSQSLTSSGVQESLDVRPMFDPRNVTVEWLDQFMTAKQYDKLVRHIGRKIRHSRDDSEIRELVHDYIALVGSRDGLRNRILAGDDPSPSNIQSWVWRQVLSTFRNEGTDAQTRTVKGAKTERDLRNETPEEAFLAAVDGPSAAVYESDAGTGHEGGSFTSTSAAPSMALLDVVDTAPYIEDVIAHQAAMASGMARLEQAVRAYKPNAANRYARVLGHLAKGLSPSEVADAEHVSHARAATLIAEVRMAGRVRANIDRARVAVIRYVMDEPMSTLTDIFGDVGGNPSDLSSAVSELLSEGLLAGRNGGSFEVTKLGVSSTW